MTKRSKYFDAIGSIMKITFQNGNVTTEEKAVLQRFSKSLGISKTEYFDLLETYDHFEPKPILTRDGRLRGLYKICHVVNESSLDYSAKQSWLCKMGMAIGFTQVNIKYIINKSLDLLRSEEEISEEIFIEEIENMNR